MVKLSNRPLNANNVADLVLQLFKSPFYWLVIKDLQILIPYHKYRLGKA